MADDTMRAELQADIVCTGFGPATAGFLTTIGRSLSRDDGTPRLESRVSPGQPLQVLCFERADDLGAGVSGVATRARAVRASFPDIEAQGIPLLAPIGEERLVYLLDPIGASRRSLPNRAIDACLRAAGRFVGLEHHGVALPFVPGFLQKPDGLVLSIGQFSQWVAGQIMAGGVQIWPASPVAMPLIEGTSVVGVRLVDQGTDRRGHAAEAAGSFTPGMDVRAALTVVGDGPVGPVGRALDERFGTPDGHERDEWALGMKAVIELGDGVDLAPGTVVHTLGFPEPEIFGFLYVLAPQTVSAGIFVPSWFRHPERTAYRYLQHWMQHPYVWRWLKRGRLRSWGAKSLLESGARAEPYLVGDGYARIGEGSGSTNALTGSGVDEAWMTGRLLAEAVIELTEAGAPFTRENLERAYVERRRATWVERDLRIAKGARDGFRHGLLWGLFAAGLTGVTHGALRLPALRNERSIQWPADATTADEILDRRGWPAISYDGQLLVSHQDALLMGGKVQAAPGYADHVRFRSEALCQACRTRLCVGMCSGQAITSAGAEGVAFDREKCVHCGACVWNCEQGNVEFAAGAGGLHSVEN